MDNYYLKEISKESLFEAFGYETNTSIDILSLLNRDTLKVLKMESAIVYCYDEIVTCNVEDINIELDNVIEARIFNETSEIKIWRDDDTIRGAIFKEIDTNIFPIDDEYILHDRKNVGEKLKIKKYISFDDNGQAYISYNKPSKFI